MDSLKALPKLSGMTSPWGGTRSTPGAASSTTPIGGGALVTTTATSTLAHPSTPGQFSSTSGYTPSVQWHSATGATTTTSTAAATDSTPLRTQTVEEIVAQHEQAILDKAVKDTEYDTRHATEKFLREQVDRMWEKDREAWLADLIGHHSLGVAARHVDTTNKELTATTRSVSYFRPSN